MRMKTFNGSSLLPPLISLVIFTWGGSMDSCKFALPWSAGQSKWFRIKSRFASCGGVVAIASRSGLEVNHDAKLASKQTKN